MLSQQALNEFNAFPNEFQKEMIRYFITNMTGGLSNLEDYKNLLDKKSTVLRFNSAREVVISFAQEDTVTTHMTTSMKMRKETNGWVSLYE